MALFDRETITRLLAHYQTLLAIATQYPDAPIPYIPLLENDERADMLEHWNRTAAAYPGDARLPDLVVAENAGHGIRLGHDLEQLEVEL